MKKIIEKAIAHAKLECPEETCGLIGVKNGKKKYIACNNISENKEESFSIDPIDYAKAEDEFEITHIVHSHPNINPEPSQADLVSIEKSGLPWLIVNPRTEEHTLTEPSDYSAPMVGREFSFGILDCYSIVKDHYAELGIELPEANRTNKFWERGEDLYLDNYKKAGFEIIDFSGIESLEVNDVILITMSSTIANHAAVYLGDSKIIHHIQDRVSSIDVYGGYWLKNTLCVLRHKEQQ